jgi:hypothetical protein
MNRVRARLFRDSLLVLFFLGCGFSLPACASLSGLVEIKGDVPKVQPLVFQSEDLVVYRLQGGETSEGLAERFLKDRRRPGSSRMKSRGPL